MNGRFRPISTRSSALCIQLPPVRHIKDVSPPRLRLRPPAPAPPLTWQTWRVPSSEGSPGGDAPSAHHRLIVQLRHGQSDALKALFDECAGVTYRLCLRMLTTPEDAEEALHDTFLRLQGQAEKYDPLRGTVQTFILTIARHLCLERLRARRSRPQPQDGTFDDPAFDLVAPAPQRDPLDQALVEVALRNLSECDRALLEAMFFAGYTHSEMTAQTGLPLGTVKSRLRRALQKLRERMTP